MYRKGLFKRTPAQALAASALAAALAIASLFTHALPALAEPSNSKFNETGDEFAYKVMVERHLEEKLNTVLKNVTGTENLVAVVNAEVETALADRSGRQEGGQKGEVKDVKIVLLPGVPARDQISRAAPLLMPQGVTAPPVMVKRLVVKVLLDKRVSKELSDTVHDVAITLIGYNPDRGDTLEIRQMEFLPRAFDWHVLMYPPTLGRILLFTLAGAFLLAAAWFFANPFRRMPALTLPYSAETGTQRQTEYAPPQLAQAASASLTAAGPQAQTADTSERPFGFVSEEDLPALLYLMKARKPEDIALVANYLRPELSLKFLEGFPPETQAEAAADLMYMKDLGRQYIENLEAELRGSLRYITGGETRLGTLLNLADEEFRDRVMEAAEGKSTEVADRLRKKLRTFESLIRSARSEAIQRLLRDVPPALLARVLAGTPGDVQARVLGSLSKGVTERLQEEMKYTKPLSGSRLRREKQRLALEYQRLLEAGQIEEETD